MSKHEAAVIMAYTGICMLQGENFTVFHKYCEDLLGHPIWTHEFPAYENTLKEKSKSDFLEICRNLTE